MKIYSMTATFGKLERQTLTLQPGLNIIEAPNEWGKSTWCAFLVSMLYGIATKERTKLGSIADKERYAPWSGSPMSGRMDLCWNGRDITIERRTKGRAVFGDFKAYETATGLPVPELTAANCGQMLLGVEKSVFTRAGFIRLTDLPVSDDEALRRRLNALVTTGDESGASDALEQKLRDLKNHCRYNKSGLLPQAEAEKTRLEDALEEMKRLDMEIASEFITMASHLMLIKTKMLLSAAEQAEAESELDLLRQSLIERQRKEAIEQIRIAITWLEPRNEIGRCLFTKEPEPLRKDQTYRYQHEVNDLLRSLDEIADRNQQRLPPPTVNFKGIVGKERYPVTKKATEVVRRLILRGVERLKNLFKGNKSRSEIVATFLAVLELCKTNSVNLEDDINGENPNVRLVDSTNVNVEEMT